jgi:integrase
VPLSVEAVDVVRGQIGKHQTRVFVDERGRPIDEWPTRAQKAWEAGCATIGEPGFRFHDLRHTWASWHAQHGTPELVLQALGGWKTAAMVRRYAHLSLEHLRPYAEAQFGHSAERKEGKKKRVTV